MGAKEAPCMDHINEECPNCGIVHRVIDSIPARPATDLLVDQLEEMDGIEYVSGIAVISREEAPPSMDLADGAAWVSNELVLSTSSRTQHLVYTPEGWVVYQYTEHDPDDDPEVVGELAAMNATDLNDLRETRPDDDDDDGPSGMIGIE